MIRCVRIWTAEDGNSLFEEGTIDLAHGERGDVLSDKAVVTGISYRETNAGGAYAPHQAPARQFVITLSGTLEFKTVPGATFVIRPGDILLAEDTTGSGHSWRLTDGNPWRRAYVILASGASSSFPESLTHARNSNGPAGYRFDRRRYHECHPRHRG